MFCSCILFVVGVFVLYKLIDRLLRIPRIGNYGDRWILVTGCDTGFGNILAKRLDGLGCHVFAGCFTEKGETELRKVGSERLHVFPLDVTNRESVQKALEYVKSKLPQGKGLWGLMNNAGVLFSGGPVDWVRADDYIKDSQVNLFGLIDVTLTFLPLIKKEKGRVVNTSSIFGVFTISDFVPYCISKYGVEVFTDGLRRCLRPFGCKVSAIQPGIHKTFITSPDNVLMAYKKTFEKADPTIQAEYGQAFFKYVTSEESVEPFLALASDRPSDVADAYEHALLGCFPRARYMVGFDAKYIYYPIKLLPEWLGDLILEKVTPKRPLPACLIK